MPETLPKEKRQSLHLLSILTGYSRILTNKHFIYKVVTCGILFSGFISWIVAGPFLVINDFGYSPFVFATCQLVILLGYIVANVMVKTLIEAGNVNRLISTGITLCLSISLLGLILVLFFPTYMFVIIVLYIIYSFGSGFAIVPLTRLAIEASQEGMGVRIAILSTVNTGCAALGSLAVSLFFNGSLFSIAAILLCISFMAWMLNSRDKETTVYKRV